MSYLFLSATVAGDKHPKYVISMAPTNSSGDIYHILGYLILARSHAKTLPKVMLTYDIPSHAEAKPVEGQLNTGDQVKRSLGFAKTLGLGDCFEVVAIKTDGQRENARQAGLHKYFSERGESVYYVDQMATTVLVAKHMDVHGHADTVTRLRQGFAARHALSFPAAMQAKIDLYTQAAITQITNSRIAVDQPLIILHDRYSSKANKHLNLPDSFVAALIKYFNVKGIQVCMVCADGRKKIASYGGVAV
jgi:hypothetical protein